VEYPGGRYLFAGKRAYPLFAKCGFMELREEICKYQERKYNLKYDPKTQVIVTVGGSEGIDIALRALVGPEMK